MVSMRMMYAQPLLISYVLFLPVLIFSIFAFYAVIGKYREAKDKTACHQQIKTDSKAQVTVKTLPVFVCSPNNVVDLALIALNLPI